MTRHLSRIQSNHVPCVPEASCEGILTSNALQFSSCSKLMSIFSFQSSCDLDLIDILWCSLISSFRIVKFCSLLLRIARFLDLIMLPPGTGMPSGWSIGKLHPSRRWIGCNLWSSSSFRSLSRIKRYEEEIFATFPGDAQAFLVQKSSEYNEEMSLRAITPDFIAFAGEQSQVSIQFGCKCFSLESISW
jgi:hypothetical protein